MLIKLMKHEVIASYRTYMPIYLSLYIVSILTTFSYQVNSYYITPFLIGILALLIGAMGIFTIYNLVISLGTRVYGKPGYLLFSVPVKTSQIMLSKFVVNFLWILLSIFVSITSLQLALGLLGILPDIASILTGLWLSLSFTATDVLSLILFIIAYFSYFILFFMFLFALLNLIYKGEKKFLVGIILYFVVSSAIGTITRSLLVYVLRATSWINSSESNAFLLLAIVYLVFSALFAVVTYKIIDKKLELQ